MRELVIARYNENIDWAYKTGIPLTVYDKSESPPSEISTVVRLPNIGREAHTYLYHLTHRYETLAAITYFCQGDALFHCRRYIELLDATDVIDFTWFGNMKKNDSYGHPNHPFEIPIAYFYKQIFGVTSPPQFDFAAGALFAVTKDKIFEKPREFYERLLQMCLDHTIAPWCFERLWYHIFHDPVIESSLQYVPFL